MKGIGENDPERYRRSKVDLGPWPDPSQSFTYLAEHGGLLGCLKGLGQQKSGKHGGLTVQPEHPLQSLVAVIAQAILATAGGLEMALRRDHHLADGMLNATNLDGSSITLIGHLGIVISCAESGNGSLQKRGFINP
jgi:hypothetical protein